MALALAFTDWTLSLQPGVTDANARRIRVGMTLEEVEALLGGLGEAIANGSEWEVRGQTVQWWRWVGSTGVVRVIVDETGRVVEARWRPSGKAPPGLLARLRAWLGW